jgi:hypothetical protein
MAFADGGIVSGKHFFRPPPRPVPFNDAGDGDIANRKFFHTFPSHAPSCGLAPDARPFGSRALRKLLKQKLLKQPACGKSASGPALNSMPPIHT